MLRGILQDNINLGVFQETKFAGGGGLARESSGYRVAETEASIPQRGGIEVFYRKAENFLLEALYLHGPNTVSFQVVTGQQQWHAVGCYISPDEALIVEDDIAAISRQPQGAELLVAGNFNADLANPEGIACAEEIDTALAAAGLEDMSANLSLMHKPWTRDWRIWIIRRRDWVVRCWTYCQLGTDSHIYQNLLVRNACHKSNHYLVLGCLWGELAQEHVCYLRQKHRFPFQPPINDSDAGCLFA